MLNRNNITSLAAMIALTLSIYLMVDKYAAQKRIAYVRSSELVYGYLGMKESHNKYEQQIQAWQTNIDTLKAEYQSDLEAFMAVQPNLNVQEREARKKRLNEKQQSLLAYARSIDGRAQEEDKKMTEGVLNQINSFVAEYGREKGYDVILGTTESGSLMYGNDAIDITQEVLESLNKSYKGEISK